MHLKTLELQSPEDIRADVETHLKAGQYPSAKVGLLKLWDRDYKRDFTAYHLGDVCTNMGDVEEGIRWYRWALALNPSLYVAQEHLIFAMDALPTTTDAAANLERKAWWQRFGAKAYAARVTPKTRPDPDKRLRVAYLSGDYFFHSAAVAFVQVVTNHTDQIEPVFYSTLEHERYDHRTKLWQERYGAHFVDVSAMSAHQLALTIVEDEIDILVDLSGYTGNNRLVTFAYRPAPIQIQAWGYVLGTQSPAIDIIFADPIVCPPTVRAQLTERVVDLPSLLTYLPRPDLPPVTSLPPCVKGAPVFSVFQRAMKVNDETVATWRAILERIPDATIQFRGGDYTPNRKQRIAEGFGPTKNRITFEFQANHREHMLSFEGVDLALDPWPQTGGVSTLEAFWMGVPCVTWIGERMIQRTSASFLTTLGCADFIAQSREEYIEKVIHFTTTAAGKDRLAGVRLHARDWLQASPIMAGYVDAVEAQYRNLWRELCAKEQAA